MSNTQDLEHNLSAFPYMKIHKNITHYLMTIKVIFIVNVYVCVCRQIIIIIVTIVVIIITFNINFVIGRARSHSYGTAQRTDFSHCLDWFDGGTRQASQHNVSDTYRAQTVLYFPLLSKQQHCSSQNAHTVQWPCLV